MRAYKRGLNNENRVLGAIIIFCSRDQNGILFVIILTPIAQGLIGCAGLEEGV